MSLFQVRHNIRIPTGHVPLFTGVLHETLASHWIVPAWVGYASRLSAQGEGIGTALLVMIDGRPASASLSQVGSGGSGAVHRAWQVSLQRLVAIKLMEGGGPAHPAGPSDEETGRFVREFCRRDEVVIATNPNTRRYWHAYQQIVPCIRGTAGNNVLVGTNGNDVLCGLGGDDRLVGGLYGVAIGGALALLSVVGVGLLLAFPTVGRSAAELCPRSEASSFAASSLTCGSVSPRIQNFRSVTTASAEMPKSAMAARVLA